MMRKIAGFLVIFCLAGFSELKAQVNARLFQQPDVSRTHITFSYAGDIWLVEKGGGTAYKLSSPPGQESYPKFSPDGSQIAFSGNYGGNSDVYAVSISGGLPQRLTYHGYSDRVVDWHPNGQDVLLASSRASGRQRFNQFYLVDENGGLPVKMDLPYAEFGSFSEDGKKIAFTFETQVGRNWKRYQGGWAPDIYIFNLESKTSEKITGFPGSEELPMWHQDKIYFLSDQGPEKRMNLWVYDLQNKNSTQLTHVTDYDIHSPSLGPQDIVYEAGGGLYLLDLATGNSKEVKVQVITDQLALSPKLEQVKDNIQDAWIAPDGNRVLFAARGEIFSAPAEKGFVKNLSGTSGVAERYPAWSPDGKSMVYWSDKSGEYELYLQKFDSDNAPVKITNLGPGFRYQPYWSPDSKMLAFIDQKQEIYLVNVATSELTKVDKAYWLSHGGLENFSVSWSPDSKWLAYSKGIENRHHAIYLYHLPEKKLNQVTSGFYHSSEPAFDPEGKYLYHLTQRHFSPEYSDTDNSFIYPNSIQIAAVALNEDVISPLAPENDEVTLEAEKEEEENDDQKKKGKEKKKEDQESGSEPVNIAIEGFEERTVILPPKPGNYGNLQAVKGKIIYQQFPNTGSEEEKSKIKFFNLEDKEEKTIIDDINGFQLAANGEKMLVYKSGQFAVIKPEADQKMDKQVPVSEMQMVINSSEEWKQIFNDAWRLQRDYFYDPNMHGVDWDLMKERYGKLVNDAATRWDLNFIMGELIGELNASHTYKSGGDLEEEKTTSVGYLGIDWETANGKYRVKNIIRGSEWDAEVKSPLDLPGVKVEEGDYILAVNGEPLDSEKSPYAAFQGLAGKTVELTVNDKPEIAGASKILVKTLNDESRLRHLAWIEKNRKQVAEATEGKVGYIYVRSTGIDGQNELVRQFIGQFHKEALIIDERFNSGGQIPDRFIELLNRKPLAYWGVRDGRDWQWPPVAHFGPKVMLINGWSGSGGDAFPDYFRRAELGPLVGTRTWGGLIGISGVPSLVDGGFVTVPTFRMYYPEGKWFPEGYGVEPDFEVPEDPGALSRGTDLQLEKAIDLVKDMLEKNPYQNPERPVYEKRN